MSNAADPEFQQRMQRIEALLQEIEEIVDSGARETVREVVRSLLDLNGAGLAAVLQLTAAAGPTGQTLIDAFARDPLISSLLLLYGLHPLGVETRVRAALDKVRPFLRSHKGDVELIDVSGDAARLRLLGKWEDCSSSAETLRRAVEEAVGAAAPDLASVEIEGIPVGVGADGRISLPLLG